MMLLPALGKAKQRAQSIHCINNVKQIALAVKMYQTDNNDIMPSATNWCADVQQYTGSTMIFECPSGDENGDRHYAFNAKLSHLSDTNLQNSAMTVMIFESDGGWNTYGGRELLTTNARHGKSVVVGFVDGHVELVSPARLQQLKWEP
jgi:prepilin-type processing-associated H-X9-DG protein